MLKQLLTDRATRRRLFRYLAVGGSSAVVQFASLWLLEKRWGADVAFLVSYVLSVIVHYLLVRFWALPSDRRDTVQQFGEYLLTVAISFGINYGMFKLCLGAFGLSPLWAAVCAAPPTVAVVFLLLNFRVFSRNSGSRP